MLSSAWIHIQYAKLSNHVLKANDVSNNVNLNTILKYDLSYSCFVDAH
jgi:hypothetical protein